ncbi:MAG: hypothetical protein RIC87_11050 [Kiloniellales bacterium]
MTTLTDLEETAAHFAGQPLDALYGLAGLQGGPIRIVALVGGAPWPPRLLLALDAKRRGLAGPIPGSKEAHALLSALEVPLVNRHLSESPLRTG